jgi:hypothetical protein
MEATFPFGREIHKNPAQESLGFVHATTNFTLCWRNVQLTGISSLTRPSQQAFQAVRCDSGFQIQWRLYPAHCWCANVGERSISCCVLFVSINGGL